MWVTAGYLQYKKCQIKFEKGCYNVIQKVKTLPVNKDQNSAAAFSISIEHLSKLEKETHVPLILRKSYPFLCQLLMISTVYCGCSSF